MDRQLAFALGVQEILILLVMVTLLVGAVLLIVFLCRGKNPPNNSAGEFSAKTDDPNLKR